MKSTLKNILETKLNKRLICPGIFAIVIYLLSYQIPKHIYLGNNDVSLPIDDMIPLISAFIMVYIVSFVQWLYAAYNVMKQETKIGYYLFSAIIIGSLIGFFTFVFYPTAIVRPKIEVKNIFDFLLKMIYTTDSEKNCLPSFHCFCSTMACAMLMKCKNVKKPVLIFNFIYSFLVYLSTLFTKQHYVVDVPAGILLAIFSLVVAKKLTFTTFFNRLNKRLLDI